jgi:uncharacterized membrane protein
MTEPVGRAIPDQPATNQPTPKPRARSLLSLSRATGRLFTSLLVGATTFAWVAPSRIEWPARAMAGWDAASLTLLALAWFIILRADANATKRRAGGDDPGRRVVFVIALVASVTTLFAAIVVLPRVKAFSGTEATTWTLVTLAGVPLSWALTHTAYALKYAHLYYKEGRNPDGKSNGGLQFCGTGEPSDIDFAYFAFTIGMCFQVSDVAVTSTRMRREVLIHAVISFVDNTVILALALNVAFALMS